MKTKSANTLHLRLYMANARKNMNLVIEKWDNQIRYTLQEVTMHLQGRYNH